MSNKVQQAPVVNVNEVSRISTGTVIRGDISSPTDLRVDGDFVGKIFSEGRVVVGEKSSIDGNIVCDNVDVWGKMKGSLYVKDTLTLKATCSVHAELHVRHLVVELGAEFEGTCAKLSDDEFSRMAGQEVASGEEEKPEQ